MARKSSTTKASNTDYSELIKNIEPVQSLSLFISMISYGRSGTGKTTFASSWPKPMLILDIKDDGTDSVKDVDGVDVLSITNWEDIERAYWFLKSGKHKYKSIHIDTITQLQDKCKEHVAGEGKLVTKNQWGEISGKLGTWLMNFRDLVDDELHVHFIAQDRLTESDNEDESDNEIDPVVGPRLMPSLASKMNAAVKVIGNTYIAEVMEKKDGEINRSERFRMRVGPHAYYITKIRKPKNSPVPEFLENPTFDDIIKLMQGKPLTATDAPKKKPNRRKRGTN